MTRKFSGQTARILDNSIAERNGGLCFTYSIDTDTRQQVEEYVRATFSLW